MENKIRLFVDKKIRVAWNKDDQDWYFSIIDVVRVLNEQEYRAARNYWKVLKLCLIEEGFEPVTNCNQLKMVAEDGKQRLTDVANAETLLRIIQSIPSKKAEPFKQWLAKVGSERLNEIADPELAMQKPMDYYKKKVIQMSGYIKDCFALVPIELVPTSSKHYCLSVGNSIDFYFQKMEHQTCLFCY